ncbi:transposase [Neorhizobium huautlense]|uniref:transposase n=1 Tax=Neorhizobium huautlense TaxID=67774 RepID=UPI001FE115B5|nr:transposase [Neorhizobium huautlense]
MGKPHPIELRARVVAFVGEGNSNCEAARHFQVSPRFVNSMMILHRSSGSLAAARQGHPLGSKLSRYSQWITDRVSAHGEVPLDERGIEVHRATVGRFLHWLGLSNKKSLRASEQRRPEIAKARDLWIRVSD